jgi:hypothetical protein
MKKLLLVVTLTVAMGSVASSCRHFGRGVQGSGVPKTEKRDLGAFKSIETTGAYQIQITCQQTASFEIEGDDNILPIIRTEVRDGVLRISNEKSYQARKPLIVRINLPDLESIFSTGAGDIYITKVKNEGLAISSTGAARVEAEGQTGLVSISSTGAGKIDTSRLHAERAKVTVTGAGSVDVYASNQLDASVSGVGRVTYDGNPGVVNKSVSGIGSISKREGGV